MKVNRTNHSQGDKAHTSMSRRDILRYGVSVATTTAFGGTGYSALATVESAAPQADMLAEMDHNVGPDA